MHPVITAIITIICFIISLPIGGWLDQEMLWWIDFVLRRRL
jgi:hypothetical protein